MKVVAILDYGMGNLGSVARAIEECGGSPVIASRPEALREATHIVLPGVGAFAEAAQNLRASGLMETLDEQVLGRGIPFLGICLGMQLLADRGGEGGEARGLGWIPGDVVRLEPAGVDRRIPHVGWNSVEVTAGSPLLKGFASGTDFYFVHSYHLAPREPEDVAATTPYTAGFVSAVARNNIMGVQFHPEKSQKPGFQLLSNFLAL